MSTKTKLVSVYELKVRHYNIPELQTQIEIARQYGLHAYVDATVSDKPLLTERAADSCQSVVMMPIQEFYEIKDMGADERRLLHPDYRERLQNVDREYIALDPKLERLLTVKYQGIIESKNHQIQRLEEKILGAAARADGHEKIAKALSTRLSIWWAQPWYVRVWDALCGRWGA